MLARPRKEKNFNHRTFIDFEMKTEGKAEKKIGESKRFVVSRSTRLRLNIIISPDSLLLGLEEQHGAKKQERRAKVSLFLPSLKED